VWKWTNAGAFMVGSTPCSLSVSAKYGTPGLPSKSSCSYGWRSGSDIGWLIDDGGTDWRQTTCASSATKNRKLSTTSSCRVPSPSKFGRTPAASLARFRGWRPQDTILEFWNAWRSQWNGPVGTARTRLRSCRLGTLEGEEC
jgi:hypothetical protein